MYRNPLFETKEGIPSQVPKLVLKTPLNLFRRSPHSSPPHSHTPPQSPSSTSSSPYYSSSSSSSTQSPHTPPSPTAFQPIVQARYASLVLPANLDALLAAYLKYLPTIMEKLVPLLKTIFKIF